MSRVYTMGARLARAARQQSWLAAAAPAAAAQESQA